MKGPDIRNVSKPPPPWHIIVIVHYTTLNVMRIFKINVQQSENNLLRQW